MAVNQGAMVLFHVTSPCGLGLTKSGDWLKMGLDQDWGRSSSGPHTYGLSSEVI